MERCSFGDCFVFQESQRIKPPEAEIPEVPSQEGETTDRHEKPSERRSRHSKREQEKMSSQKRKKKTKNKVRAPGFDFIIIIIIGSIFPAGLFNTYLQVILSTD